MEPTSATSETVAMVTGPCGSGLISGIKNAMLCGPSLKRLRRHQLPLASHPLGATPSDKCPLGVDVVGSPRQVILGACLGAERHGKENVTMCRQEERQSDTARCATSRQEDESSTSSIAVAPSAVNFKTRGQLRLSITSCRGLLTVNVVQARHLKSKWTPCCTSYIEISLIPCGEKEALYRTLAVSESNQPSFEEKFTLEMMAEDQKKRLSVAMYNKGGKENRSELLGCMTFGLKHLRGEKKKQVDGWYYLLSEDVGRRKHLKVTSTRHALNKDKASKTPNHSRTSNKSSTSIPEVTRSLHGRDTTTVVVRRGRHGYGFTVMGSCPVTIGKVEDGSPAETAGLRKGDNVVRINGQNVSRSTADSVAKIVKNSQKQIILDVVRLQRHLRSNGSLKSEVVSFEGMRSPSIYEPRPSGYAGFPLQPCPSSASDCSSRSSCSRRTPSTCTPASSRGLNDTLPLRPLQIDSVSGFRTCSRKSSVSGGESIFMDGSENSTMLTTASTRSSRRASRKSAHASPVSEAEVTNIQASESDYDSLRWDATNEEIYFPQNQEIFDELPWKPFDCDINKVPTTPAAEDTYATMYDVDDPDQTFLDVSFREAPEEEDDDADVSDMSAADYAHTTLPEVSVSFCDLSRRERARQAAAGQLVRAEAAFIAQMQYGIQRFSRPLRHCILSAREHRVLFQNVEKLVAFSEYHMRQMADSSLDYADLTASSDRYVDVVGKVYRQRATILCEAYQLYSQGLEESLKLLADLKTYEQFHGFLADPEPAVDEPSIEDFLRKPEEHLQTLMVTLRTVLSHTSTEHCDADALQRVVEAFSACCHKVTFPADISTNSSNSSNRSSTSFASKSSGRSGSSSGSKSSTASVDSELLEIQERLVFPDHVKTFQLATPARHVIYTSELLRVEACMWTRVVVILLSDLLLVTKVEGDKLVVVEDPLPLPNVMNSAFGGSHPCEFTLTAEVQSESENDVGWEARHLLLRAPSMEQACTWKSLLEQRIASFRTHRELMVGRSREAMF